MELLPEIADLIEGGNDVAIKAGTGAGKSRYTPAHLQEAAKKEAERVLVLNPRRAAAVGIARRVAQDMGTAVGGKKVGYRIGGCSSHAGEAAASVPLVETRSATAAGRERAGGLHIKK